MKSGFPRGAILGDGKFCGSGQLGGVKEVPGIGEV